MLQCLGEIEEAWIEEDRATFHEGVIADRHGSEERANEGDRGEKMPKETQKRDRLTRPIRWKTANFLIIGGMKGSSDDQAMEERKTG